MVTIPGKQQHVSIKIVSILIIWVKVNLINFTNQKGNSSASGSWLFTCTINETFAL